MCIAYTQPRAGRRSAVRRSLRRPNQVLALVGRGRLLRAHAVQVSPSQSGSVGKPPAPPDPQVDDDPVRCSTIVTIEHMRSPCGYRALSVSSADSRDLEFLADAIVDFIQPSNKEGAVHKLADSLRAKCLCTTQRVRIATSRG